MVHCGFHGENVTEPEEEMRRADASVPQKANHALNQAGGKSLTRRTASSSSSSLCSSSSWSLLPSLFQFAIFFFFFRRIALLYPAFHIRRSALYPSSINQVWTSITCGLPLAVPVIQVIFFLTLFSCLSQVRENSLQQPDGLLIPKNIAKPVNGAYGSLYRRSSEAASMLFLTI